MHILTDFPYATQNYAYRVKIEGGDFARNVQADTDWDFPSNSQYGSMIIAAEFIHKTQIGECSYACRKERGGENFLGPWIRSPENTVVKTIIPGVGTLDTKVLFLNTSPCSLWFFHLRKKKTSEPHGISVYEVFGDAPNHLRIQTGLEVEKYPAYGISLAEFVEILHFLGKDDAVKAIENTIKGFEFDKTLDAVKPK